MSTTNEFSTVLRAKRLRYAISVSDAAALVGVARSTWIYWEAGHPPALALAQTAALNALDVEGARRSRQDVKRGPGRPVGPNKVKS